MEKMDNYNGQNQFGINQMNQNQYVQQQYGQVQQVPQMQYQQAPQMQYQQMPQNMQYAQSQMYQQQQNNGYMSPVSNKKPKKKWLKKLLIIGIPVVVLAIAATILMFVLFSDKYDIKDVGKFAKVCANTLDKDIEKSEMTDQEKRKYAIKSFYSTGDIVFADVQWCEFESEDDAKAYFAYMLHNSVYGKEYRSIYYDSDDCDVKIEDGYVEAYGVRNSGDMWKVILVQEDEYCVFVLLRGTEDEVKKKSEKFLREIDK